MSAKRIETLEQVEFIRQAIQTMSTRDCAKAFTEKFGESLGQTQLRRIMERNGIKASVKRNEFLPIGSERYSDYYKCMMVKTGDYHISKDDSKSQQRRKRNANWQLKQNYVWEQENKTKLPRHWVVIFLDNNRMNYSPENLFAVPLQVAGTIERTNMHSEDPIIYKTALIWGILFYILKETRRESRYDSARTDSEIYG